MKVWGRTLIKSEVYYKTGTLDRKRVESGVKLNKLSKSFAVSRLTSQHSRKHRQILVSCEKIHAGNVFSPSILVRISMTFKKNLQEPTLTIRG